MLSKVSRSGLVRLSGLCLGVYGMEQQRRGMTNMRSLSNIKAEEKEEVIERLNDQEVKGLLDEMKMLSIVDSEMMRRLMSVLRDKETKTGEFRSYSDRVIRQLIEHALSIDMIESIKASPCNRFISHTTQLPLDQYAAITILRAGNSFMSQLLEVMPSIPIGQVLIQRNEKSEEKEPVFYYSKLPSLEKKKVLLCDPMIATGGSMLLCLKKLVEEGVEQKDIIVIGVIGCREGLSNITQAYPMVRIVVGVVDPQLNHEKYICPGLGDYGDRYFGTL